MKEPDFIRDAFDGIQKLYRFDNGLGASVVRHKFSYGGKTGLWEVAVTKYHSEDIQDFTLYYNVDLKHKCKVITGTVMGYLSEEEVDEILSEIERIIK